MTGHKQDITAGGRDITSHKPTAGMTTTPRVSSDLRTTLALLGRDAQDRARRQELIAAKVRELEERVEEATKRPPRLELRDGTLTASCPNFSTTARSQWKPGSWTRGARGARDVLQAASQERPWPARMHELQPEARPATRAPSSATRRRLSLSPNSPSSARLA